MLSIFFSSGIFLFLLLSDSRTFIALNTSSKGTNRSTLESAIPKRLADTTNSLQSLKSRSTRLISDSPSDIIRTKPVNSVGKTILS